MQGIEAIVVDTEKTNPHSEIRAERRAKKNKVIHNAYPIAEYSTDLNIKGQDEATIRTIYARVVRLELVLSRQSVISHSVSSRSTFGSSSQEQSWTCIYLISQVRTGVNLFR